MVVVELMMLSLHKQIQNEIWLVKMDEVMIPNALWWSTMRYLRKVCQKLLSWWWWSWWRWWSWWWCCHINKSRNEIRRKWRFTMFTYASQVVFNAWLDWDSITLNAPLYYDRTYTAFLTCSRDYAMIHLVPFPNLPSTCCSILCSPKSTHQNRKKNDFGRKVWRVCQRTNPSGHQPLLLLQTESHVRKSQNYL